MPEFKPFYKYFPEPTEPNPFIFKSKEDYFKAREKLDILWEARDEWKNKYGNITENDVLRWKQMYVEYESALDQGIHECFKESR